MVQVTNGLAVYGSNDGSADPTAIIANVHFVCEDLCDHNRLPSIRPKLSTKEEGLKVGRSVVRIPAHQIFVRQWLEDETAAYEVAWRCVILSARHQVPRGSKPVLDG